MTSATLTTAPPTTARLHLGIPVKNLDRSAEFYRLLLGVEGVPDHDGVRFLTDAPAVAVRLYRGENPGQTLNHVGLRLADSAQLEVVQRRLEEGGITTQRQEGVACCYSRQTKFWATDPDGVLCEIYTLSEDLDHSGFDDEPVPQPADVRERLGWEHKLTDAWPDQIPHSNGSLDDVRLEGTLNGENPERVPALLAEAYRVLRVDGELHVRSLVGDRPFPDVPALPGPAAVVRRVPVDAELEDAVTRAGFVGMTYDHVHDVTCFSVDGVRLSELRLVGRKPGPVPQMKAKTVGIVYKGPFAQVTDEDGTVFPVGEEVKVTMAQAERLRVGPSAGRFAFV